MPQMMPCSWMLIFLGSVVFFLVLNSIWSAFFFLLSFPKDKNSLVFMKSKTFWC